MHSVGVHGVSEKGYAACRFKQATSAMLVWHVLLPLHLQALLAR
jgi:hypothetical protein